MLHFLEIPGSRLTVEWEVEHVLLSLVDLACSRFQVAAMTLDSFNHAYHRMWSEVMDRETARARRQEVESQIPPAASFEASLNRARAVDRADMEAAYRSGRWPSQMMSAAVISEAERFILCIHTIRAAIDAINKVGGFDGPTSEALGSLDEAAPDLVEIRNSIAHVDDRLRRIGRRGKTIVPEPVDLPGFIRSTGGSNIMLTGNMNGDRYTCTLASGAIGQMSINEATLLAVKVTLQSLLNALPWTGPLRLSPQG